MRVGVVTDDFTGGNDLAGRFAREGFRVYSSLGPTAPPSALAQAPVVVLNAASRLLTPARAGQASRRAWQALERAPSPPFLRFQKIDSTLRGNLAPETRALADLMGGWVAVCPAYPRMGRQARGGWLFVHGRRLDKTEYSSDPLSPARQARVDRLFLKGESALVPLKTVEQGAGPLKARLQALRKSRPKARFVCFDATQERHLRTIARACLAAGCRAFAGASGLGGALAGELARGTAQKARLARPRAARLLVLAGTMSQTTLDQLEAARRRDPRAWVSLEAQTYLQPRGSLPAGLVRAFRRRASSQSLLCLSSVSRREDAWEARAQGRALGLDPGQVAQKAMDAISTLAKAALKPGTALLATGGHTAETFFKMKGLAGAWIMGELLPGLPWGWARPRRGPRLMVLSKPGGFGDKDLLKKAARRLLWRA